MDKKLKPVDSRFVTERPTLTKFIETIDKLLDEHYADPDKLDPVTIKELMERK